MAKKTRKPNLPQETLERARKELYGSAAATKAEAPRDKAERPADRVAKKPELRVNRGVNLREEYAYVLSDLQNMGLLAAALMGVLVIMSFFI